MPKEEITISDYLILPKYLFHLVPQKLFYIFTDKDGNYDCINKKEWGKNSPFVHTSPTKKQLKERVADINWSNYPLEEKFLLLKIDPKKVNSKITYSKINSYIYHHIWGSLPKNSFEIFEVKRDKNGKFTF